MWERVYSNTHKQYYYFNKADGSKSWTVPEGYKELQQQVASSSSRSSSSSTALEQGNSSRKRSLEDRSYPEVKKRETEIAPVVAIIVPFRDLHKEQKRSQHLKRFIPEISQFLQAAKKPFRVYIIEQSDDGRKFNRGKLLNIGFALAKKDGCSVFVFHDVDLIPSSSSLLPFYTDKPSMQSPVHVARVWDR